jgi:hypothetical protein
MKANGSVSSRPDQEKAMAIFLTVLSVACAIGVAISFLRYDSKHFDLLVFRHGFPERRDTII